jgi:hypothetical protein
MSPRLFRHNISCTLIELGHPVSVHLEPTTIVHSLLLPLKLAHPLPDCHTLRNRANRFLTLLCVNSKQSPDPLTDLTPPLDFNLSQQDETLCKGRLSIQSIPPWIHVDNLLCIRERVAGNSSFWHSCWKSTGHSCTARHAQSAGCEALDYAAAAVVVPLSDYYRRLCRPVQNQLQRRWEPVCDYRLRG